ncbi:hypothetical protein OUZ56_011414 [Daphnia magna]|uniref:Uncharacterized protein n=1 Tax=Daphnia magna TaxID=35525 RepID=A0ABQ9Z0F8_9CRUS|nr:hypothetical protein OUZ56_011414 [Daphnia magna]
MRCQISCLKVQADIDTPVDDTGISTVEKTTYTKKKNPLRINAATTVTTTIGQPATFAVNYFKEATNT